MANTKQELSLQEIAEVLRRHVGSMKGIAENLDPPVRAFAVSNVLAGKSASRRILAACHAKALALLKQERKEARTTTAA